MGNSHSGSSKDEQSNISIYEILQSAGQTKLTSIKRLLIDPELDDSGADSPKSTSSNDSSGSIGDISCDQKRLSIVTRHSSLSLNLECRNFDIITNLRISDKESKIDHVDLMVGHRRFNATRDGTDLVIYISIPKFILSDTSPLRLDIYPKTQENPEEISYCYGGYTLDDSKKARYLTSRIEDKHKHIIYLNGLVC
jgi:hypothetical protein